MLLIRLKYIILFIFVTMIFSASFASDSIVVKKDPRLDVLTTKQVQMNKRNAMLTPGGMYKGYRIQLLSTTKRDDAFKLRAELMLKYPEQKTYVVYQSPSFRVRIGNFLKKEDAEKLKAELNKFYPNGVYIVDDGIEYTPKDEDELVTQ